MQQNHALVTPHNTKREDLGSPQWHFTSSAKKEFFFFYCYICILWEETMTITAERTERQQGQQHGASHTNITLNATKTQFQQHTLNQIY